MTKRETAVLAFRVLAVYMIISSVSAVWGGLLFALPEGLKSGRLERMLFPLGLQLAQLLLAVSVWYFANFLASRATADGYEGEPTNGTYADVRAVAFSIIGMFYLVQAVNDASFVLFQLYIGQVTIDEFVSSFSPLEFTSQFGPFVIKFVLALLLLFGSRGFAGMVRRFRDAGLDLPEDS